MKTALTFALLFFPFLLVAETPAEIKSLREQLKANPADVKTSLRLAEILVREGDEEGAIRLLEEAVVASPENADLHKDIASIYFREERFKEAIPHLREALEITGGNESEYGALARMMLEIDENEAALAFLEKSSQKFPESADFPFLGTFALSRLERWEEAIAQFEKTVSLAEESRPELVNESFYFRFAAAHERAGQFAEAETLFRKTLDLLEKNDPDGDSDAFTATVLNYLAYMWVEQDENLPEAGEMARRAATLSPDSGAIADTVGWVYFKEGNFPRALVELKKAERLIEEPDPVIFDHLGQTLAKLGEKTFAADYFRQALELDPKNGDLKARLAAVEE